MSVFNKIIIIVLLSFVIFLGVVIAHSLYMGEKLEQAQIEITKLKQARDFAEQAELRAMAARQVENEKAKQREQLMENVLCDNHDWSDVAVPDDVARMLQQSAFSYSFSSCLPSASDTSR